MTSSAQREAFERAIRAWNDGNLNGYLELYDERIQLHGYSDRAMGNAEIRSFYEGIFEALSEIELVVHEIVETTTSSGPVHPARQGSMAGVEPTGRRASLPGFTILRFGAPRPVERYSVPDFRFRHLTVDDGRRVGKRAQGTARA